MIRRFFDRLQVGLYLLGMDRLASFLRRFGTPTLPSPEPAFEDRPTLKVPVFVAPEARGDVKDDYGPIDVEEPKVIYYEPNAHHSVTADVDPKDIVYPATKYDVN